MAFHKSSLISEFIAAGKKLDSIDRLIKSIDQGIESLTEQHSRAVDDDCRPLQQALQLLIKGYLDDRRRLKNLRKLEDSKMDVIGKQLHL